MSNCANNLRHLKVKYFLLIFTEFSVLIKRDRKYDWTCSRRPTYTVYLGHGKGQRCSKCEHLSPTQSVPGIDRWLACEVELSSTLQASRRLSAMKIFADRDLRRNAATKSQVGRRYRTRLWRKAHCDLTRIKFRNKSQGFVPKFKSVWD